MEVMYVRTARSIWLLDTRDLNPRGISLQPIVAAVRDRYQFQKFPKTAEELTTNSPQGVTFAEGSFALPEGHYDIIRAALYADGFVVDTAVSTAVSDAFLEDLLGFVSTEFGLRYDPAMITKKNYASELIVKIDDPFRGFLEKFAVILNRLGRSRGVPFRVTGVTLGADPQLGPSKPADFRVEREINKPFEQNRYYCLAPLQTDEHIALLEQFEKISE